MKSKIGFIGSGNMGSAMIKGIVNYNLIKSNDIYVSDIDESKLKGIKEKLGVNVTTSSEELVNSVNIVVLSVKPNIYSIVLNNIKKYITNDMLIITIAAGISIEFVENVIGSDKKIIRTMPNRLSLKFGEKNILCYNVVG